MSWTKTVANFSTSVLIIVISFHFNDQLCTFRFDLHQPDEDSSFARTCASPQWGLLWYNLFHSNSVTMSAPMAAAKLSFRSYAPCWLQDTLAPEISTNSVGNCPPSLKSQNNPGTDFSSWYAFWLMGHSWDSDVEMWAVEDVDINQLTGDAIQWLNLALSRYDSASSVQGFYYNTMFTCGDTVLEVYGNVISWWPFLSSTISWTSRMLVCRHCSDGSAKGWDWTEAEPEYNIGICMEWPNASKVGHSGSRPQEEYAETTPPHIPLRVNSEFPGVAASAPTAYQMLSRHCRTGTSTQGTQVSLQQSGGTN